MDAITANALAQRQALQGWVAQSDATNEEESTEALTEVVAAYEQVAKTAAQIAGQVQQDRKTVAAYNEGGAAVFRFDEQSGTVIATDDGGSVRQRNAGEGAAFAWAEVDDVQNGEHVFIERYVNGVRAFHGYVDSESRLLVQSG